jgi:hypothetical protein
VRNIDSELRARCTDFLYTEADLLDRHEFEQWLELFTPDAEYWLPIDTSRAEPHNGLNLIYDDLERMHDRVRRLRSGYAFSEEPLSRTVHLVGNVRFVAPTSSMWIGGADPSATERDIFVATKLVLRRERRTATDEFAANCVHQLTLDAADGDLRIRSKRVDLINAHKPLPSLSFLI